jgi:ribosomal protein S18 acetylase RimI-like enzyme
MPESLNYTLRPITAADEPFLWELLYQAIYIPEGTPPLPREIINEPEIARYVLQWGQPDDIGVLAIDEISQQAIGAVWLRLLKNKNKGYGYIDDATPELSIAVMPEHRGKGVGTQPMSRILSIAGNKYEAISLSVSEGNPAMRLYGRLGFEIDGKAGTSVRMKKELKAGSPLENRTAGEPGDHR